MILNKKKINNKQLFFENKKKILSTEAGNGYDYFYEFGIDLSSEDSIKSNLDQLKIPQLKELAKKNRISKRSRLNKPELKERLENYFLEARFILLKQSHLSQPLMSVNKFETYWEKIKPLIIEILEKNQIEKKRDIQKDMLLVNFSDKELNIHRQVHKATMMNGKIWEVVFFNFLDWEKIGRMDGKSEIYNVIIELKNQEKSFNNSSRKGTMTDVKKLRKKYPNYQFIFGYVNDDSSRNYVDLNTYVHYLGGNSLFKYVFGHKYYEIIQKRVIELVVSFYYEQK